MSLHIMSMATPGVNLCHTKPRKTGIDPVHLPSGRLPPRWSLGKGSTTNRYDAAGNLTNVVYPVSPALKFTYDKNNRLKSMIDGTGTSTYTYTDFGALLSEDGPWSDDVVSYAYDNGRRRQRLSVGQPGGTSWSQSYAYDAAGRLDALTAPEGTYDYQYHATRKLLVQKLVLPNGASITNGHDGLGRLTHTHLRRSDNTLLNRHDYVYNAGHQRTKQTRTDGDYVDYTYDNAGQVRSASGKESGGSNRLHEQFGYTYDAGGNLAKRTNNALIQTLTVDNLNQLSSGSRSGTLTVAGTTAGAASSVSVNGSAITPYADRTFARAGLTPANGNNTYTAIASDGSGRSDTNAVTAYLPASPTFTYDDNGNLLTDGRRSFTYDDENQLISVSVASAWKAEFAYDGRLRRRVRKEYLWQSGAWKLQEEIRYVYDGLLPVQERNGLGVPNVTYTRGSDLSDSLQGAGGIGGLLARTEGLTPAYYHAEGNGNITALVNGAQWIAARYLYDPYGNTLAQSGPLAKANLYRFSSKEFHPTSGLSYYLYRYYDPSLQRWLNRDPLGEPGFISMLKRKGFKMFHRSARSSEIRQGPNLFTFVRNAATDRFAALGLKYSDEDCKDLMGRLDILCGLKGSPGVDNNDIQRQINQLQDEYDENCGDDGGDRTNSPTVPILPFCPYKPPVPEQSFCERNPGLCIGLATAGAAVAVGATCVVCPQCCLIGALFGAAAAAR